MSEPTYFAGLTGANCTVGGQTIVSLSATEDADADYDSASALCLAHNGPHSTGELVQTIEGGVSTGYWEVEDPVRMRSGERTWRRKADAGSYAHLPLYTYKLRRKGWKQARATLSRSVVGGFYPPKFCTDDAWRLMIDETNKKVLTKDMTGMQAMIEQRSWLVGTPADVIRRICSWVALPVNIQCSLPYMPQQYTPVSRTIITAVREIASWSAASVFLDRNGVLQVYDWLDTFNRSASIPMPASVLEEEVHDSVLPVTEVTVVGTGYEMLTWHFAGRDARPMNPPYQAHMIPAEPARDIRVRGQRRAIEKTVAAALYGGEHPVEERVEMNEYDIDTDLAEHVATERITRYQLGTSLGTWRGPAEGCQGIRPLVNRVYSVNRSLNWQGSAYRYEISITAPTVSVPGVGSEWW